MKKPPFDLSTLLVTLESHGVTEFEYEGDGHAIKLRRGCEPDATLTVRGVVAPEVRPVIVEPERDDDIFAVKSPMIGTFYRAPSPGAPPFVSVGSKVEPGTTLCIIEAMKLMNEIKAERAGTVSEVLCENGSPVKQGQEILLFEAVS